MRAIILSAVCLFAALPAAYANSGSAQGVGAIGFIAGTTSGNQGSTFSQFTKTNGSGGATGSSASGTVFSTDAANGSGLKYTSFGSAHSDVSATPFGVTTNSNHDAGTFGTTWGTNASVNASNQTFGQANGYSSFTSQQKTKTTAYDNSQFQTVGAIGFAGFEGSYTKN